MKDSGHFIRILRDIQGLPPGTFLVVIDVTSLYINIPHKEAVECIRRFLIRHRSDHDMPTNESLIDLLELVLTLNNFQFNGKNYLQVGGDSNGYQGRP